MGTVHVNLNRRIREFLRRFVSIEVASLGFVSGGITLLPVIEWRIWASLHGVITLFAGMWSWWSTKPLQFSEEVILDVDVEDGQVFLEVPTPYHMLVAANNHARELYGHDALKLREVEKWWKGNPLVEAVLRSEHGAYLGYFDVLPLTEEAASLLESGKIDEHDIKPEYIMKQTEMKKTKTLYLAGMAVKDAGSELGKSRAAKLFCGLVAYTRFYYGDTPRRIFALAATSSGERLLKGVGAKIVCAAAARKDHHDLYEMDLKHGLLAQVESRASRRGVPARFELRSIVT
jgi:hypothetical protein